jgi:hypothetical protein
MRKKTKWLIAGLVCAFFNPIPSGLLIGYCLYKERGLKKEGKITLIVSAIIAIMVLIALTSKPA